MVQGKLSGFIFFLLLLGQLGWSQPYNPTLTITTSPAKIANNGYVNYTTSALSGDARFSLTGAGYFATSDNFNHQFPYDNNGGFTTTTFFNRRYKKTSPTKRTANTGNTGTGTVINNKIWMPSGDNSRSGISWYPSTGIENYFLLIFENTSSSIDTGCVEFFYDDNELNLNNVDILEYGWVSEKANSTVNGSTDYNSKIKWKVKNFLPGEQRVVYIPMTSKVSTGTKINVGTRYSSGCAGGSGGSGLSGVNGSSYFSARSPHDPNSKTADRTCVLPSMDDRQSITYLVKYQNSGDGPAMNVVLKDKIDVEHLDISTLNFLESEYDYTYTILGDTLIITFPNINLPGSKQTLPKTYSYDDTESYIKFSICTQPDLPQGVIKNQVGIYFDTQPVVNTNVCKVDIIDFCGSSPTFNCSGYKTTGVNESTTSDIILMPNPIMDVFYIDGLEDQEMTISILNNQGKIVKTISKVNKANNSIDLMYLPSGMYFVNMQNETINITKKVIKL